MARAAFEEMAEILRGFVPAARRDFRHSTGPGGLKVWFASWHEHYEAQVLGRGRGFEVGFHAEHPNPAHNDAVLDLLGKKERTWRRALGDDVTAGPFLGRKEHAARWRRVSEVWDARPDDEGTIVEAAERLATYIATLEPILVRAPDSTCACWKQ